MTRTAEEMGDELAARLSSYPPAMVRHFVPILLIRTRTDLSRLPPPLDTVMRSFAEESGLSKAKSEAECLEGILRYYDKRPIAPELRALLREVVGGGLESMVDADTARRVAAQLGAPIPVFNPSAPKTGVSALSLRAGANAKPTKPS